MTAAPAARGILVDIEGTTTPISFVYDVLFPYARKQLARACREARENSALAAAVQRLRSEYEAEPRDDPALALPEFGSGAPYAAWLMDRDRKSTGLKELQGLIWEAGYASGELRGIVFDDVPPALAAWRERGVRLRVFSSGSVLAQRLLFSHCAAGDLTPYFEGFHDTTTGPKKAPASYASIATAYGLSPGAVLFLSDVVDELEAAATAGMLTGLMRRPGNPPTADGGHSTYTSFTELL